METGASTTSTPAGTGPISPAGPNSSTPTPRSAAIAAPAATSLGPRSAPPASTATWAIARPLALVGVTVDAATLTRRAHPYLVLRPRGLCNSHTPDIPGEATSGCGTVGTRCTPGRRSCAAPCDGLCGHGIAFALERPSPCQCTPPGVGSYGRAPARQTGWAIEGATRRAWPSADRADAARVRARGRPC